MQAILSIIIILASIISVVLFGVPQYKHIGELKTKQTEYITVLEKVKTLTQKRKELTDKRKDLDIAKLEKLEKMVPNSPENVPLILELDALARHYNLSLQNVKVEDPVATTTSDAGKKLTTGLSSEVGVLVTNFSVTGSYVNFTDFVRALEKNLRIIDVQKIAFTALEDKDQYQYSMSIRTYWLK